MLKTFICIDHVVLAGMIDNFKMHGNIESHLGALASGGQILIILQLGRHGKYSWI